jgi:AraC-like DNA-binding protein
MILPNKKVWYGKPEDPFHIEFSNRTGLVSSMNRYHIHHHYEVVYLISGERGFFIKDRSYTVRPGDLVIINSNEIHKSFDIGVPNYERVVVYYDSRYFSGFTKQEAAALLTPFGGYPIIHLSIQERMRFDHLLAEFIEEITNKPPAFELRLQQLSAQLLVYLFRFIEKRNAAPVEHDSPIRKKVLEIVQYINKHYEEPLRLSTISGQFYISPSYLSKVFKSVTGFVLTDYVNIVRVKEAQRLLRDTDWSITEISERVGFDNFSHFGKMFKRISSLSPRAYRRQYKG